MRYPGGKGLDGVFQRIINQMPPHDVYAEPFLGGGAILRIKRLARLSFGFDKDLEALEKVAAALAEKGGARIEIVSEDAFPTRRAVSAAIAEKGGAGSRGRTIYLVRGCGIAFLKRLPADARTMVYCDPPYVLSTRTKPRYRHELSDRDHARLLAAIDRCGGRVMITGYRCPLYEHRLKHWRTVDYEVMTRGSRNARETLWLNYPSPEELHDYAWFGADYRERENVRKRRRNFIAKLQRMNALERGLLFDAIEETCPGVTINRN